MKVILVVASMCGLAFGALVLGPRLIAWSPWYGGIVVLVGIIVISYFDVRKRERMRDEEVRRRFSTGSGQKPPTRLPGGG